MRQSRRSTLGSLVLCFGGVLCLVIGALFVASFWHWMEWDSAHWQCGVRLSGGVLVLWRSDGGPLLVFAERLWWPAVGYGAAAIPLWIPFVLSLLLTVVAWYLGRGYPPGRCQRCGYDLTGSLSKHCPKCAKPIESDVERPRR